MPETKHGQIHNQSIVIKLPSDLETGKAGSLFAYVVNSSGTVIETTAFKGHSAQLTASSETLKGSRVFIGAGFPAKFPSSKIDAYALTQARAYQVSASINKENQILIERLPSGIVIPPIHFCEVQGNVSNNLIFNGLPNSGPVCKAKVHICTVDWFFRWPIWLRPVIPPDLLNQLKESFVALRAGGGASSRPNLPPGTGAKSAPRLALLDVNVESQILAATTDNIHEIVFNNAAILYPYFCWWPIFWPWFYRVVEQEVVYTDCNGHYDGWLISIGDPVVENVYIWVEDSIGGNWVTVYKPPFPCNTYWNYSCGTEINIALNNAAIAPCNCGAPVVDGSVWFTSIGAAGIALNIQQDVTIKSLGIPNVGCTNLFDENKLGPFGSTLELYLAFGPNPPATAIATATHYRWKWTYILDSSLNPVPGATPAVIAGAIQRFFVWPVLVNTSTQWESGSISLLDTDNNGNIAYKIPAYSVTTYPGVSPEAEWKSFNFLSASLDSTKLSNGYVIRLDLELLYIKNGVFETLSVPVSTFQVSNDTNADGSVPAPFTANSSGNNYLTLDSARPGNALSLSLKVRVDNSAVTATINDAALLDGNGIPVPGGTSGVCGFIQFQHSTQEVRLSFIASEPFNFATFDYALYIGDSGAILAANGYVFNNAPPFMLSGGVFSDAPSVASLLRTCTQAAFAENLSVSSLATDGSSLLSQSIGSPYAAPATSAFALTPQSP